MMSDKKIIDITDECKKAERRQKWEDRLAKAKNWWDENKNAVIVGAPIVGGFAIKGLQILGRYHNLRLEQRNKDRRCYDTSLGHYWELKRKLNNSDWVKINNRRRRGESLGEILNDLGVLK
jgi:hypothetical protein